MIYYKYLFKYPCPDNFLLTRIMKNRAGTILFVLSFLFLAARGGARPVFAEVRCETQYGGGQVCVKTGELQVNKKVWDPQNKVFVDNLGITSYKFTADEQVFFQIEIKNIGDNTFSKVNVKDTLPNYLELPSGQLDFEIENLEPGESEKREIKAKVVSLERLPSDKTLICEVNTVEAWADEEKDKDTTQVCIEKRVLGVTKLPPTGPNGWQIFLLLSLISIPGAIYFLKSSQKRIQKEVKRNE